jgi:isoquinoline 1-oxidoreductase beta subunit
MLQKTPPPAVPPEERSRLRATRRGLLIGGGAAVGLLVGYALWPRHYPGGWEAAPGETLLNAWIRIGPDGRVTVAVPQAEMGQGVMSGFAQIVADELGADWGQMAVEPAPWHSAYAHVGMARLGTAGLPPMIRDLAGSAGGEVIRRLNLHLTGGSTSIMGYHGLLREAAADARARLIAAAAGEWRVGVDGLDTANGFVVYKANRMAFAEAVKAVDLERDPSVELRPEARRPLVGRVLPRIDLPPKVDGTARFGGDVRLPGMVFAAIRHGPVGESRLATASAPAGVTLVKGANWVATTGPTSWEARRALERVDARFETRGTPAGEWIEAALAKAAAGSEGEAVAERGDIAGNPAHRLVEARYTLPFLSHACMEPMVATARVVDGRAEVWGPTQSLTLAHRAVAEALGIETDAVVIYPTLLGGGFGRKAEADAMVEAALMAKAVGRPVQLGWSREEDFAAGRYRPPVAARLRGRVGPDGTISSWEARVAVPSVSASFMRRTFPAFAPDPESASGQAIEGADAIPYAVEAFRAVHLPLDQPVPLGFWRSVGHSFSAFLVESFVDELGAQIGADPLAFRLRLLDGKSRHQAVLKAAAEAARWGDPTPAGFGRGLAFHESFGSLAAMVVEAGIVDGQVRLGEVVTALDCGRAIAPDSVRAQMEGAAIMGLSAAIGEAARFGAGEAMTRNFDSYRVLTMADCPTRITTVLVQSGEALGGVGEPGLPPAAPALANALYAATGIRARSLPLAQAFAG